MRLPALRKQPDDGFSPVVGVVLLVAVVVVMSAIAVTLTFAFTGTTDEPAQAGTQLAEPGDSQFAVQMVSKQNADTVLIESALGTPYKFDGTSSTQYVLNTADGSATVLGELNGKQTQLQSYTVDGGINYDIAVDKYGTEDETSIQDAVDSAENGDTIVVERATYTENVDVNKEVTLIAEPGTVIKDRNPEQAVIDVASDNVTVSNFHINADPTPDDNHYSENGIYVNGSDSNIRGNVITNATYDSESSAVYVNGENNTVYANSFTENTNGVTVASEAPTQTVRNNNFGETDQYKVVNTDSQTLDARKNAYNTIDVRSSVKGPVDASNGPSLNAQQVDLHTSTVTTSATNLSEPNVAPSVSAEQLSPVQVNTNAELAVDAVDPDGDSLTYEWDFNNDGSIDATGQTVSTSYSSNGYKQATVTVTDEHGESETQAVEVPVYAQRVQSTTTTLGDGGSTTINVAGDLAASDVSVKIEPEYSETQRQISGSEDNGRIRVTNNGNLPATNTELTLTGREGWSTIQSTGASCREMRRTGTSSQENSLTVKDGGSYKRIVSLYAGGKSNDHYASAGVDGGSLYKNLYVSNYDNWKYSESYDDSTITHISAGTKYTVDVYCSLDLAYIDTWFSKASSRVTLKQEVSTGDVTVQNDGSQLSTNLYNGETETGSIGSLDTGTTYLDVSSENNIGFGYELTYTERNGLKSPSLAMDGSELWSDSGVVTDTTTATMTDTVEVGSHNVSLDSTTGGSTVTITWTERVIDDTNE